MIWTPHLDHVPVHDPDVCAAMTPDPLQTLERAIQCHRIGDLAQAERLYRDVLAVRPDHAECLHLLGALCFDTGRHEEAAAAFINAIRQDPSRPVYINSLGTVLRAQGRLHEAAACFAQALRQQPLYPEACCNLGITLHQQGKLDEAVACYREALRLRPDYLGALYNLGTVLRAQACLDEAAACFRDAITRHPGHRGAWYSLGTTLYALGRLETAAACLRQAVALEPEQADGYNILGAIHQQQGGLDAAAACYRRALRRAPGDLMILNNLCGLLYGQGRQEEALACCESILNRLDDILITGRRDECLYFNILRTLFASGRLGDGWRAHELRWRTGHCGKDIRGYPFALWTGEPLTTGSLLIWGEQGLGDEIMFAGLIPDTLARNVTIRLKSDPRLHPLLARSFPGIILYGREDAPPPDTDGLITAHITAGSLPGVFRNRLADFPVSRPPYLHAAPEAVRSAYARHGNAATFRIGLSWSSRNAQNGAERSIPLEHLAPAVAVPGSRLISLQYGDVRAACIAASQAGADVCIDGAVDTTNDIDGLAALISAMNLVITIDNTTAHLAGALGVPVWVLLPCPADWRWMERPDDCPWYPTMRLFRQTTPGDWQPVLTAVRQALEARLPVALTGA